MIKKLFSISLVTLLVSLFLVTTAFASHGDPVGTCSPPFELHHNMDHSGDPLLVHIGLNQDLNGDGYICIKMLRNDLHLHVDNFIPSP